MLKLVLGRAGSGKTEYVFSSIKRLVEQGEDNILLLTPEQFSFVSEQRLLRDLGESKINCVQNMSFSGLSKDIYNIYGKNPLPLLSKGSKAVVFKAACSLCRDELSVFQKNIDNIAFINSAIEIYDELKTCRVSQDDIQRAVENVNKPLLSQKLNDISKIINTYDNLIKDKYLDSACELTSLYEKIKDLDYFVGKTVFIDGFAGFAAQEYKILEVVLKQAKSVTVTFCSDSFNNADKYDLFSYVNSNIRILYDVASKLGVKVEQPVMLTKQLRFNNDEMRYVEKYSFSDIKKKYSDARNVHIYSSKGIVDECNYVARNISRLLRKGVRASEIAVICRDMDKYRNELSFAFAKYNIPYFNDERQSVSCQVLIRFVAFLLRIVQYSYRSDDIFSLLKLGLTSLDAQAVSSLENYAFMWSINGSKWKKEFTQSPYGLSPKNNEKEAALLFELNKIREYIVGIIEKFKSRCKNATAKDISAAIYYCLLDFEADKGIKNLAVSLDKSGKTALAEQQGRIWDLLMDILNSLATVCGEEKITVKEYSKLFRLMISNEDLGSLPSGLDNVQFGSADRIRCDKPYATFVVGANEGEFPSNILSGGLLSDSDRTLLVNNDFKLFACGEILNSQEKYYAYMALSSPSDMLFVSFKNSTEDNPASEIVSSLQAIFSNEIVTYPNSGINLDMLESKDNAFELLSNDYENDADEYIVALKRYFSEKSEYKNRLEAVERLVKNEPAVINNQELSRRLFGKNMYLSASRIEDYYNCAFRYFCKFALNARKRTKAELDPMQTGTVIHYVLENLVKDCGAESISNMDKAKICVLVNKYLNEYLQNELGNSDMLNARFKYQLLRLSKMLCCVVERLSEEFRVSEFVPQAFELTIGNGENGESVKSKVIDLPNGTLQLKGAIDRVDVFENNGVKYVRVVDYKSGTKEFNLSDILYGLNLQMFVYLFTLCESDSELAGISSGVLYMHSARSVYNMSRNTSDDELQKADRKEFKMKGVVLNDNEHEIAQYMEKDLNEVFIPVKKKKDGTLSGNIVSFEDLGRISRKINELIYNMGCALHSGYIMQNPINAKNHDKTCEYCDYTDVCMNRKEIELTTLQDYSFDEVLLKLKEDEDAEVD